MAIPGLPDSVTNAALGVDGTLAMLHGTFGGVYEIVLIGADGQAARLLPDTLRFLVPRFGPGGARVALRGLGDADALWILDRASGTRQPLRLERSGGIPGIVWTRSGQIFVGLAPRLGTGSPVRRSIRELPADGSDTARIVFDAREQRISGFDVSADGQQLAVAVLPTELGSEAQSDIMLTRLDSTQALRPLATGTANQVAPRFSPDGRWLAYASDESGEYEVYVRSRERAGLVQVSDRGGGQPVWSVDGKRLYYFAGSGIVAAELGETPGGGLEVRGRRSVFEGDLLGRLSETVATYDVDAAGRIIAARMIGAAGQTITVRTGWIEGFKAQLAARRR
jgi:dipeptidyl aminopeptidase/acylaminoacyl peptidase